MIHETRFVIMLITQLIVKKITIFQVLLHSGDIDSFDKFSFETKLNNKAPIEK